MKRGVLRVVVLLVVVLSTLGCVCGGIRFGGVRGSGRVEEEERLVRGFTGVELATFGNLDIRLGDEEALRIEAEDNLLPYFETEVRNGILEISSRPGVALRNRRAVNFYLTAVELDTIRISGSGDVTAPDLEAGQFSVRISGSGNLEMEDLDADGLEVRISGSGDTAIEDLRAEALEVDITGSGSLDIAGGEVEEQGITIRGSGKYRARRLDSAEAEGRISGSGDATVQVRDRLKVNVSGSGDVRYVGSPDVDRSVTGSGDVEQIGE
jgi:hypothetical protein